MAKKEKILFEKGNQFWKNRTKHGRDKLFETPDVLWQEVCKYFEFCDENPLIEIDYKGRDADRVEIPKMRAYTWSGLELFLDIESLRWYKTGETYSDFLPVITRIEKIIYTQKFEGSAAGFLNPNIIARDLGLIDRKDVTQTAKQNIVIESASEEERRLNEQALKDTQE